MFFLFSGTLYVIFAVKCVILCAKLFCVQMIQPGFSGAQAKTPPPRTRDGGVNGSITNPTGASRKSIKAFSVSLGKVDMVVDMVTAEAVVALAL